MGILDKNKVIFLIAGVYFAVAITEVMSELFAFKPLIYIFKPLLPTVLMVLYWATTSRKNPLFFIVMLFSLITNVFFIPNTPDMIFYGLIAFMIHRILIIYYIIVLLKIKDYVPVLIASIPFLMIFFYMFLITTGIPENSFFVLIFQNILISLFCGISFSHYMMNDNKKNSWLLLCGILFGALQFIVFIEKFYLSGYSPIIFRPIAMGLNAFAFYTFYEFVIATEKSDNNSAANGGS
jgi:hypothetical protein